MTSAGTDRLGAEGKVKKYRGNFYLGYTFETFRVMVLVVGGRKSQDHGNGGEGRESRRNPTLRNSQIGKFRLYLTGVKLT